MTASLVNLFRKVTYEINYCINILFRNNGPSGYYNI